MTRVGFGFDLHPLVPGRPLVLGGVTVPAGTRIGPLVQRMPPRGMLISGMLSTPSTVS